MNDAWQRLLDEIYRLGECHRGNEDYLEALQSVQGWVIEEMV